MLRVCNKCYKIHNHDYKCKKKVASRNLSNVQIKLDKFYRSYQWNKLKNQKKKDELYHCEICRVLGKIGVIDEVHHIKKVATAEGWEARLDYENLIGLCHMCHKDVEDRGFTTREEIIEYYLSLK